MRLVHTPGNIANRLEWHRVQDHKQKGLRIAGAWWILFGPLLPMFNQGDSTK